jgi:prolyl-tRNA synthetase
MLQSHLFGATLRSASQEVEVEGHRLLLRAGYVRQLAAGIFTLLPLGLRAARKIEAIIRDEINAIGGQELSMPVVHPADIWRETGRWYQIGEELLRFRDRNERDMVLAMTHEEVVTDLARREIRSYRQLPALVYQIQTKFRDEPRPRAGLVRVREFIMKDSYSMDVDQSGLERQYRNHYSAYFRIFDRIGLRDVIAVASDTGMMGGKLAHEFMFVSEIGEDTLVLCDSCHYASNLQVARFNKIGASESCLAAERVSTPQTSTIASLAALLGIQPAQTAKAVFYSAGIPASEEHAPPRTVVVLALVRGDMEVNETKLSNAIKSRWLKPATIDEIDMVGAVPGYASPVGLSHPDLVVVVDDLVAASPNLVGGANEVGFHLRNLNYGRDYKADIVTDVAAAFSGAPCINCENPLRLVRGVEVGNIFQLGTRYTEAMGAFYLNAAGQQRPIIMGSYGIGVGRALACVAESYRDERGLCLPISIAPFDVHLIDLSAGDESVRQAAKLIYHELMNARHDTLFDDRDVSAGNKFADADLIGVPLRATISPRSISRGGVEIKSRTQSESKIIPISDLVSAVQAAREELMDEISARVRTIEYWQQAPASLG